MSDDSGDRPCGSNTLKESPDMNMVCTTARTALPAWALSCLLIWALMPAASAADPLQWSVTPYLWATKTSVDLKADGTPIGAGKISFNDLMDATDASFQVFVEAGRGRWSGFADVTYLDTSDSNTSGGLRIKTDSKSWVVDMAAAFWPAGEEGGLSLFAGMRYTSMDDEYKFVLDGVSLGTRGNDRSFTDVLLGARYNYPFSERWALATRVDGSFGDSEGTFQLEALLRYAVGKRQQHGLLLGYRYKEADFESGRLEENYEYKGPVAGFNFRF